MAEWSGFLDKRVKVVFDDKDKVSVAKGTFIRSSDKFVFISDATVQAISKSKIIRIEVVE